VIHCPKPTALTSARLILLIPLTAHRLDLNKAEIIPPPDPVFYSEGFITLKGGQASVRYLDKRVCPPKLVPRYSLPSFPCSLDFAEFFLLLSLCSSDTGGSSELVVV